MARFLALDSEQGRLVTSKRFEVLVEYVSGARTVEYFLHLADAQEFARRWVDCATVEEATIRHTTIEPLFVVLKDGAGTPDRDVLTGRLLRLAQGRA